MASMKKKAKASDESDLVSEDSLKTLGEVLFETIESSDKANLESFELYINVLQSKIYQHQNIPSRLAKGYSVLLEELATHQ